MPKISASELKVLSQLQFSARAASTDVARQLSLHHNTVLRSINRLSDKGIITPALRVNVQALGLKEYVLLGSFSAHGAQHSEAIVNFLGTQPNVNCAMLLCGQYDVSIEFHVWTAAEAQAFSDLITKICGAVFSRTALLQNRYWCAFEKRTLSGITTNEPRYVRYGKTPALHSIDSLDRQIIDELSKAPLLPLRELSQLTNKPFQTLSYRIHRLVEQGVIVNWEYSLNYPNTGLQAFLLFLKVDNADLMFESDLHTFCCQHSEVAGYGKRIGEWNFELYLEVSGATELHALRLALLKQFGKVVTADCLLVFTTFLKWQHSLDIAQDHQPKTSNSTAFAFSQSLNLAINSPNSARPLTLNTSRRGKT
jgi:DNA-binding Lrp family transcriptional regulator